MIQPIDDLFDLIDNMQRNKLIFISKLLGSNIKVNYVAQLYETVLSTVAFQKGSTMTEQKNNIRPKRLSAET
ncbi:hypothetical protein QTP88_022297 [Uroleucon formosanum]